MEGAKRMKIFEKLRDEIESRHNTVIGNIALKILLEAIDEAEAELQKEAEKIWNICHNTVCIKEKESCPKICIAFKEVQNADD